MHDQAFQQQDFENQLHQPDNHSFIQSLEKFSSADLADILLDLSTSSQIRLLEQLPQASHVFEFLPLVMQQQLAEQLPQPLLVHLLTHMHSDDRTDLFQGLSQDVQHRIFQQLDTKIKAQLTALMHYPQETAGAIMSTDVITVHAEMTMQQAIQHIRIHAAESETLYLIYVTDESRFLHGVISLRQIIQSAPEIRVGAVMTSHVITGLVREDQESIAQKLAHYDFMALPIVDEQQRLLGIVTYDDAMDVVQQETTEDILKSSAVAASPGMSIKTAPILSLYKKRVFWLVFLVFGSLLSGLGIAHFEDLIAAHIVLVFFLPLLVGSGGNAGSQSATLMVRALATGDVHFKDWFYLLGRESLVALCLGATMATAVSILGYFRGDIMVAVVLALSMMGIVMMGCLIGMSLPFILNRMKLDPASASAPLVTSICDASGVVVYLLIASQILTLT